MPSGYLKNGIKRIPPSRKGIKLTDAQREKLKLAQAHRVGIPRSAAVKFKISLKHRGKVLTEEHKKKLSIAKLNNPVRYWKGKKLHPNFVASNKTRKRPACPWRGQRRISVSGENHWNWKGGISPENAKIRGSLEYRLWRMSVFRRDNFTCKFCFKRGGKLNADHIKRFSEYPELRLDIDNGRTLCVPCHKTLGTYHGK